MIRKLKKKDRTKLRKILIDTNHFNKEEIKVAMELVDVTLNNHKQKDYVIYVYEIFDSKPTKNLAERVAGYICYGKRPLTDSTYDLYWIAVDPKIHGKGIGSELIEFMEDDLKQKGVHLVLIETSGKGHYEGERKFYEKNGYSLHTIIKDFYREGDDLYVYRKYLN